MLIRYCSIIIICLTVILATTPESRAAETTLYQKNSLYQYIAVIEDTAKKERYIFNNRRDLMQGGMLVNAPDSLLFEYTQTAFVSLGFMDREPLRVLFIGLGAGSMPRYFSRYYPNVEIDVVEIDPDIADVARRFFHFSESTKMRVAIEDGRVFLKRSRKQYDIIFIDAYQGGDIPFHLTTVEFLREVKKKLADDGVVATNILSQFKNRFFDSMIATYKQEFPHLYIFKGRQSNNFIFIAPKGRQLRDADHVARRASAIQAAKRFNFSLPAVAMRYEGSEAYESQTAVLTDDFAPVNLYQHMKSR
jgi:spermidine synthase